MSNPVLFVRCDVLGLTQAQLAAKLHVSQPSVWRWEKRGWFPGNRLTEVRRMARKARRDWSDTWLFEPPSEAA